MTFGRRWWRCAGIAPDLVITAFDAAWTGLIAVTNLDPSSTVLEARYFDILGEFGKMDLISYGLDRYVAELGVQQTSSFATAEDIARKFWL